MAVAFQFKSNTKGINKKMSNLIGSQMPFALSKALNETAKTLVAKNKQDMQLIFDRPTRFTLNAFFFKYARKGQTSVTIRRKSKQSGRHYLEVQEYGGLRPQTGMEQAFQMNLKYGGILQHVGPTKNTPRNKNGNMTTAFRNKVMSAMQVQRDVAQRSKTFGRPNRGRQQYFVPAPSHPLSKGRRAGVYERNAAGNAKKVLNFIDKRISYRPILRFDERMNKYGRKVFPSKMKSALRFALSTARLR